MEYDYQDEFYLNTGYSEIHFQLLEVYKQDGVALFGGYDTRSSVEIKTSGFWCKGELYISTGQLNELLRQLEICYKELKGVARIKNEYENNFQIEFNFDGLGHINISGFYHENSDSCNRLNFSFDTDQTYIFQMLSGLRDIASKYGHSG